MKRVSNRLLGVSVRTPPTLSKSRRPKGGKALTLTPPIRQNKKKGEIGVSTTSAQIVDSSSEDASDVNDSHDQTEEKESIVVEDTKLPASDVNDSHDQTKEE